jgi:hypothetical protein
VISAENEHALRVEDLEEQNPQEDLQALETTIDIVTKKNNSNIHVAFEYPGRGNDATERQPVTMKITDQVEEFRRS